jgi:hypothetical protein
MTHGYSTTKEKTIEIEHGSKHRDHKNIYKNVAEHIKASRIYIDIKLPFPFTNSLKQT